MRRPLIKELNRLLDESVSYEIVNQEHFWLIFRLSQT
jgi:hypothetical protein